MVVAFFDVTSLPLLHLSEVNTKTQTQSSANRTGISMLCLQLSSFIFVDGIWETSIYMEMMRGTTTGAAAKTNFCAEDPKRTHMKYQI